MKISIPKITYQEIELSDKQMKEVTRFYLKTLVSPGEYLRTDKDGIIWLKQDDPDHRHGSISEEKVRVATDLDKAIFEIFKHLK